MLGRRKEPCAGIEEIAAVSRHLGLSFSIVVQWFLKDQPLLPSILT
jgi:hypothetical protein